MLIALTCDVVVVPENHFHVIPHVYRANSSVGLGKHHILVSTKLIGLHRQGLERESLVHSEICHMEVRITVRSVSYLQLYSIIVFMLSLIDMYHTTITKA